MRHITRQGLELIKQFEGFTRQTYWCPAGYLTIGYGHIITEDQMIMKDYAITPEEGENLLRSDVRIAESAVLRHIKVSLSDNQFDALVSFTFNLGGGALQASTLRRKVNQGLHTEAAEEFKRWVYAGGVKLKGLIRRRNAEAKLYLGLI